MSDEKKEIDKKVKISTNYSSDGKIFQFKNVYHLISKNEKYIKNIFNSGILNFTMMNGSVTDGLKLIKSVDVYDGNNVIQDPAGSAIGTGDHPYGSGASGVIYNMFRGSNKLACIPQINPTESTYGHYHNFANSSDSKNPMKAPVIHTHSPIASGSPLKREDRNIFMKSLVDSYKSCISIWLNKDVYSSRTELSLVPLAASIYGGNFRYNFKSCAHLHPSYTLAAILIAVSQISVPEKRKNYMSNVYLWFYEKEVYDTAKISWQQIKDELLKNML